MSSTALSTLWLATLWLALLSAWSLPLTAQEEPLSSLQQATAMAEEMLRQRQDPVLAALERVDAARQADLEAADKAALQSPTLALEGETPSRVDRSVETEDYATAVAALARTPDHRSLPALAAAASHDDPDVRYAAMTALREGASAGQPSSRALLAARGLLLHDSQAQVRRQAFEAYCRWADQDDVLALSQSLGSAPGPLRDLAVREWLRIERERSAR